MGYLLLYERREFVATEPRADVFVRKKRRNLKGVLAVGELGLLVVSRPPKASMRLL
jgi:hypothetical protein